MSKETEEGLSILHKAIAATLVEQVSVKSTEFSDEGEELGEVFSASPAVLGVAIKFLKDNSITCDMDVDDNMSNLRDLLDKKQKHTRIKNNVSDIAEAKKA